MKVVLQGKVIAINDGEFTSSKGDKWYTWEYQVLCGFVIKGKTKFELTALQTMDRAFKGAEEELMKALRSGQEISILVDIFPSRRDDSPHGLQCRFLEVEPVTASVGDVARNGSSASPAPAAAAGGKA